ncbi:pirin family protein [Sedimentitalea sp. XS_ASV28]|uniref:pirin family protein n=1 Tax=Sedimentitalea sp. XS_ASV28 TaxID=3241296 RepID=UPI0035187879
MSWNPSLEPGCPDEIGVDAIETLIIPRARDLGGFEVRRALPAPKRQMVGPFIFFDQAGPAEFLTGQGVDVRPHPHIGLGTVTYLYRGDFHHRDSIGSDQIIEPGALNWMVAGKGVTHSERTSSTARQGPHSLFGIQTWMALPEDREDMEPLFEHHGKDLLPEIESDGVNARLILGTAYGEKAPATLYSETFYLDVTLDAGARFPLPDDHEDRGLYITQGSVHIAGQEFEAGKMMVFRPGDKITVQAGETGARLMALGGATMNGPRHVWWNFVSSSKDKIEAAKEEWRAANWGEGIFDLPQDDRSEFIPLPEK